MNLKHNILALVGKTNKANNFFVLHKTFLFFFFFFTKKKKKKKKELLIHLFEKKMDDALTKILGPTIHASSPVMDQ
jgi:hypothetical protein